MKNRIQLTIVGAGHYGIGLIAPKYLHNKSCVIKAVIDPVIQKGTFMKSVLASVPLYKNVTEWEKIHKKPQKEDLFELSLHYNVLPLILRQLAMIGAKNFVLPKPIALDTAALTNIRELHKKYKLNSVIGSQWYYSKVTHKAKQLLAKIKKRGGAKHVFFNFSQSYDDEQLKNYLPNTALLPHILQIIYSIELSELKNTTITLKSASRKYLAFTIKDGTHTIEITTDLSAHKKVRTMNMEALQVDFLATFENEEAVHCPSLTYKGKKWEFKEDNLQVMVDATLSAFQYTNNVAEDKKALTLEKYMPIAKFQANLHKLILITSSS